MAAATYYTKVPCHALILCFHREERILKQTHPMHIHIPDLFKGKMEFNPQHGGWNEDTNSKRY